MGRDTAAVDQRDEVVVVDAEYILTALGHDWLMLETYVKPYPCCRRLHSPIDAALGLREKLGDNIDAVEGSPSRPMENRPSSTARMSIALRRRR